MYKNMFTAVLITSAVSILTNIGIPIAISHFFFIKGIIFVN